MRLRRIRVHRLHDLPPFSLEGLRPGINLLVGPNASGKSSLMRLVQHALWPQGPGVGAAARLEWDGAGGELACELDGPVRWLQGEHEVAPPDLPPAPMADCWILGLADLLDPGAAPGERARHDALRRLMAGGFDLDRARAETRPQARPGQGEARTLGAARAARRSLALERAGLARDEDGIADRRQRLAALDAALSEAKAASQALARLDAVEQLARIDARLAALPDLEAVAPDDLERFDRLVSGAAREAEQYQAHDQALADLDEALSGLGLGAGPVPEADLSAEGRRQAALEASQARVEAARVRLAALPAVTALGEATSGTEGLEALDAWLLSRHQAQAAVQASRATLARARSDRQALGDAPTPDPEALEAGLVALDDWLAAVGPRRPLAWPGGVLVALGLALWASLPAVAGVVFGVGVGLWAGWAVTGLPAGRARRRYPQGLPPPEAWRQAPVRAHRLQLGALQAKGWVWRRQAEVLDERHAGALAEVSRVETEARRLEAQAPVMWEPALPEGLTAAWDVVDRLRRQRALAAERAAGEAEHRAAGEALAAARAASAERLGAWGVPGAHDLDVPGLRGAYEDLVARSRRWRELQAERSGRARLRDRARTALEALEDERQALLHRTGCAPGSGPEVRRALEVRVEALPEWRRLTGERAATGQACDRLEAALADWPHLGSLDRPALTALAEAAGSHAEARDALLTEVGRIEGALQRARASQDWEQALAREAGAADALAQAREAHLLAVAADHLLDEVAREHATLGLPPVAARASALFARFTHHRYTLEVPASPEAGPFLARDAHTGAGLGLEALSDGSRMQLRLAARVAFAESLEAGGPLPLFLDESLTASDPQRFQAVAEALLSLEGRQLFYLTSSAADVAAWEAAARATGRAVHRIDLPVAEPLPPGALVPSEAPLPAPDGRSPEAWGAEVGVPLPDPWAGVAALSPFHLLRDDLALVHHLLAGGVTRVGGLLNLLDALDQGRGLDPRLTPSTRRRIRHRVAGVAGLLEAWQVGRPRPVSFAAVLESGALTERYQPAARRALESLQGDAAALVEAVRTRRDDLGFGGLRGAERRAETLAESLETAGHLDPRPPLEPAQVLAAARAAAAAASDDPPTDPELEAILSVLLALLPRAAARAAA